MIATSVIGTIPTWILVAMALFIAWRLSNSGGGGAMDVLTQSNKVLEKALSDDRRDFAAYKDKTGAEIRDLRIENGELRGRTDVALAISPILDWTSHHELRAQERHDATLVVLDLIAQRLGPDPNGHETPKAA